MSGTKNGSAEAFEALAQWVPTQGTDDLKILSELAERSLKEVKALTEYEDGKAQRILTAIAFLAAVAGGVFALAVRSLQDAHVMANSLSTSLSVNWLAVALFGGFALYSVLLVVGGAQVLYAVKPRFNLPEDWKAGESRSFPTSFLFFEKILEIKGVDWVKAFAGSDLTALRQQYVKNSVIETYIVAEKIQKKLKPLQNGVSLLFISTIVLSVWLPIAIFAIAVPSGRIG
jgi:hypothetical protein